MVLPALDGFVGAVAGAASASLASGGALKFDIEGMKAVVASLAEQVSAVGTASSTANNQLGGVTTESDTPVDGVNSAYRWLAGTAVASGAQVSYEENLAELDQLVSYLHQQLSNVVNAYEAADAAGASSLNHAAAQVFGDNQKKEDPASPGDYSGFYPGYGVTYPS